MKLNCDLGESFGAWSMPVEAAIMAEIDQANIACGFQPMTGFDFKKEKPKQEKRASWNKRIF